MNDKVWKQRPGNIETAGMLADKLAISNVLAQALVARGIDTEEAARDYLTPSFAKLIDPSCFADMDKAAHRIVDAIRRQDVIGVFGDYDVDGVCSATILQQFLLSIGAKVCVTLPHRMTEGYGLSKPGVMRLKDQNASLIITVDCGISAHEAISFAYSQGLEVIVVDHHEVGETLPDAYAVVNPKRSDCNAKADYLCAAGVTFFLCLAVRRVLRSEGYFLEKEPDVRELLDLVALATVCDVVPLIHNNRILVKAGLSMIKQQKRLGLKALMDVCGIDPKKITSTNLGFHLGPRINAAGRLEDAAFALRLLSTADEHYAHRIAMELHETNDMRKSLEQDMVMQAAAMVEGNPTLPAAKALVLYDEQWHPGVVGIVASRIAERFHRPAIIIGEKGKGSGRSIRGIDLHAMVNAASSSLAGFGGHGHAIGLTLGPRGVEAFRAELLVAIEQHVEPHVFIPEIFYDAEVSSKQVSLALIDELMKLDPFGAKNPHVVVRLNQAYMRNVRRLAGGHLKGELETSDGAVSFIGFRMDIDDALVGKALDILAVPEKNEWQGIVSPQLRLVDFRTS